MEAHSFEKRLRLQRRVEDQSESGGEGAEVGHLVERLK